MHSTRKQTWYIVRTTWTVFKRYIPGGGEGDVWGNLLHHPSAYSLFSAVILHNFNDFRTNLLRFWPTFWVDNGRRRATLLLVLGVSFWSICCHVCYCCKLYEFVGNFFFFFFGLLGVCTVGFYALTINCVYAMWQPKVSWLKLFSGGGGRTLVFCLQTYD